jgi:hypothetical protein
MGGSAQLNPMIIGRLPYPDQLATEADVGLPESDMPAVADVVGGLFTRQILDAPKDVEIANGGRGITAMREAIGRNLLRGLEGNGIRRSSDAGPVRLGTCSDGATVRCARCMSSPVN